MAIDYVITRFIQHGATGLHTNLAMITADFAYMEAGIARTGNTQARVMAAGIIGWGAITALMTKSMYVAGQQERVIAGLATTLRNSKLAESVAAQIRAFDIKTPFTYLETAEAAQRMTAAGFRKDLIPAMEAVGNAAVASGGGSEKFVQLAKLLSTIRIDPFFKSRRIMAWASEGVDITSILKEKLHLSEKDIFNIGKLHLRGETVANALVEGFNERFQGGIERSQNTLLGSLENMKASTEKLMATIGDIFKNDFRDLFKDIINIENNLDAWIQKHPSSVKYGLPAAGGGMLIAGLTGLLSTIAVMRNVNRAALVTAGATVSKGGPEFGTIAAVVAAVVGILGLGKYLSKTPTAALSDTTIDKLPATGVNTNSNALERWFSRRVSGGDAYLRNLLSKGIAQAADVEGMGDEFIYHPKENQAENERLIRQGVQSFKHRFDTRKLEVIRARNAYPTLSLTPEDKSLQISPDAFRPPPGGAFSRIKGQKPLIEVTDITSEFYQVPRFSNHQIAKTVASGITAAATPVIKTAFTPHSIDFGIVMGEVISSNLRKHPPFTPHSIDFGVVMGEVISDGLKKHPILTPHPVDFGLVMGGVISDGLKKHPPFTPTSIPFKPIAMAALAKHLKASPVFTQQPVDAAAVLAKTTKDVVQTHIAKSVPSHDRKPMQLDDITKSVGLGEVITGGVLTGFVGAGLFLNRVSKTTKTINGLIAETYGGGTNRTVTPVMNYLFNLRREVQGYEVLRKSVTQAGFPGLLHADFERIASLRDGANVLRRSMPSSLIDEAVGVSMLRNARQAAGSAAFRTPGLGVMSRGMGTMAGLDAGYSSGMRMSEAGYTNKQALTYGLSVGVPAAIYTMFVPGAAIPIALASGIASLFEHFAYKSTRTVEAINAPIDSTLAGIVGNSVDSLTQRAEAEEKASQTQTNTAAMLRKKAWFWERRANESLAEDAEILAKTYMIRSRMLKTEAVRAQKENDEKAAAAAEATEAEQVRKTQELYAQRLFTQRQEFYPNEPARLDESNMGALRLQAQVSGGRVYRNGNTEYRIVHTISHAPSVGDDAVGDEYRGSVSPPGGFK